MKKILVTSLLILSFLVCSLPGHSATWYANALNGQNIDYTTGGAGWFDTDSGDCTANGTQLTWGNQSTNDIFEANNCAGIIINTDPKGTGAATKVHLKNTQNGSFSYALATAPPTTSIDATAVAADLILLTGSTAGKTLGITGSVFTASATVAGADAIYDTHTTVDVAIVGAFEGGTGANGCGYYANTASGTITATGNATAHDGVGFKLGGNAAGIINGNCTGSSVAATYGIAGCSSSGTGGLTVTGNLIDGSTSVAIAGHIHWTPTAPANGVTGHYYKNDSVYVGKNTNDVAKALTTFYFIDTTDGSSDVGTETSGGGGGGAWGF